ncbi:HlyD family efflux transporter periplasmic adaptor subunit [Ramlibacter sp.]|uniref:HlyD family efflux transporter periplasmic adaptor subunit n=1 Tax=Ramlibacter sp. TaxID=1917967 RepID=UPI003D0D0B60
MITREDNLQRKALRVAIPLFVELDGSSYQVRDWSTTGLGIDGLPRIPAAGEIVPARISFPMLESTLVIPVQLVFRGERDGTCGFEFHDLSARNRRVLRHYIELSVDGKLGDVEDIVAAASLPATRTPVDAPLNLSTLAPGSAQQYRNRAWRGIALGLVMAGVLGALGLYNYTYPIEGTGFVSGSIARITANHDGRIARLMVQPGTRIEPNMPLFAVENPALRNEVEALEQHVAQLSKEQSRLAGARRQAEAGLLSTLKKDWAQREAELNNARKLFDSGVITQREVLLVSNQVNDMQQAYLRQVADGATRSQSLDGADVMNRLRVELAAKKVMLARQDAERTVRASVKGKVFQVDKTAGEFVSPHDPVVLVEADITPSVLLRLPNDDALKLRLGMPATIYVPYEDRKYSATVSAVGLAAASAGAAVTQEGGLNETLVKLEFQDKRVRLPANARVNVYIRNPSALALWS